MIDLIYDIKKELIIARSKFKDSLEFDAQYTDEFPVIDYRSRFEDVLFFDSEDFHNYHEKNAAKVYKLTFTEDEDPVALCYIGERCREGEKMLSIPYSSPFSRVYFSKKSKTNDREKVYIALKKVAKSMKGELKIILPPEIYYDDFSLDVASFMDSSFETQYLHINNYFDLREIKDLEDFVKDRSHSYRKNLKKARAYGLLVDINEDNSLENAYKIIEKNRSEKGYPLNMSYSQIKDISNMPSSVVDSFVLYKQDEDIREDIASAIVFKVKEDVVQVIYWGSLEDYSKMRPMELLSLEIIRYYKEIKMSYIDIGPSTANDKISHGLYGFKVNIGCKSNLKPVITG